MSSSTSKTMYRIGKYFEKNPTWQVEKSPWKAKQILKIIKDNNLDPYTICDVGCGAGEILNQLYLQMHSKISFTGYELSPDGFELCQSRKKDRLQFHLGNLFDDNNAFFDLVMAIDVVEHVENYFDFLRNLRKKGKYKILHIPLEICVQTVFRGTWFTKSRQRVGHIHYFTKETALAALTDTGYEIVDWFYTSEAIDLPFKSFKSLLARYPRKIFCKISKDITVRVLGGYSLLVLAK